MLANGSLLQRLAHAVARCAALRERKTPETATDYADAVWPDFVSDARVILLAVRQSTVAMDSAALFETHDSRSPAPVKLWAVMIDAALKEEEG